MQTWNELMRQGTLEADKAQGYFRYYRSDGTFDEMFASDGKLFKRDVVLPIEGLTSFQTKKVIEAVQYKDKLYIATGTKLVEYDGTSAKVVEPYTPQPQEALYIGTNGLADNPQDYITDGSSAFLEIKGIKTDKRYGVVNQKTILTAFVSKPAGTVEYKFESRLRTSDGLGEWDLLHDWSSDKTAEFVPSQPLEYEFRVSGRMSGGTEVESEYYLPRYGVTTSDENEELPSADMHTCNRILLHWERLVLYGGETEKDLVYFSHLKNPNYFPVPNTLRFENEKREGLQRLVQFRNSIVAFTSSTIQALYGTSPLDFRRVVLNTSVGCLAPDSVSVMGNYVAFLSSEGIHILKSMGNTEDRMNVEKIDSQISNIVPLDPDACSEVLKTEYHIVFPSHGIRLRYYYDRRIWTKDVSPKLNFRKLYVFSNELYGISDKGQVMRFDSSVYTDDGHVYKSVVDTKNFDFGEPYNPKKLKELQIIFGKPSDSSIYVFADGGSILNPDREYATILPDGTIEWTVETVNNINVSPGTRLGAWEMGNSAFGDDYPIYLEKLKVSGKFIRTQVRFTHERDEPYSVLGLGSVFKLKKP